MSAQSQIETRDVCKTLYPLKCFFVTDVLCNLISQYEEEIHIWNCYLNLTFDPKIKSIGFLGYPGRMCGPTLRKVGQGILEILIGNEEVTHDLPTDPPCAKQYALSSSKGA